MSEEKVEELGELQAVYGTAPAYLQRAALVAVLSFVFFLGLLIIFSLTQNLLFFLMSTAFLVIELFTLFGWLAQRRNELKVFVKGFMFKKQRYLWNDLESISVNRDVKQKVTGEILTKRGEKITLTDATYGIDSFFRRTQAEINGGK